MSYSQFFEAAYGSALSPYPYQVQLATQPWPGVVEIPTGLGKTAGVLLGWLYKRAQESDDTPRRLVYCLPMRVLVEQTANNARAWVDRLAKAGMVKQRPVVHVLMGGELDNNWDIDPDRDAVIIGTQDQLLSRALNRGYGLSRFRWPVHFALLNNDSLWVMDEVQLMGVGLTTTAQLQAFRDALGTTLPTRSVWMSATLERKWLETVDYAEAAGTLARLGLSQDDLADGQVARRHGASKPLQEADCDPAKPDTVAAFLLEHHQPGTRSLVIKNTVKGAQDLYLAVRKMKPQAEVVLLHSRFRPSDRAEALRRLLAEPSENGTICVSTQVVEAGVDVSAATLVTDLAPWASLVQRFGRCNRKGDVNQPGVYWLRLDHTKKGRSAPYEPEQLERSQELLSDLDDVGPSHLPAIHGDKVEGQTIRQKDLVDLFDTTPDLAGLDVDVSRFIREPDDQDVQVFWREFSDEIKPEQQPAPGREELCSVSVGALQAFRKDQRVGWYWDHLEARWSGLRRPHPGMTVMLEAGDGGYSPELGWTGNRKDKPGVVVTSLAEPDSDRDDSLTTLSDWQTVGEHTQDVHDELSHLLDLLAMSSEDWADALLMAARWHDAGKSHEVFQEAVTQGAQPPREGELWGKTPTRSITYCRRGFRHELASALAMLAHDLSPLAVYLAAAHHGKVRLSIRSLPLEGRPDGPASRFARGVWDGDQLPATDLGGGVLMPPTRLDLSCMEMGEGPHGPSWVARMLSLRDDPDVGPFRLAFLEALLRVADWRASRDGGGGHGA